MTDRFSRSPSLERLLDRRPSFSRPPIRSINSPKLTEDEALMLTSPFLGYRTRYTYAKSSCYNSNETDAWEVPNLANNLLEVSDTLEEESRRQKHFAAPSLFRHIWMYIVWLCEVFVYICRTTGSLLIIEGPKNTLIVFYRVVCAFFSAVFHVLSTVMLTITDGMYTIVNSIYQTVRYLYHQTIYFCEATFSAMPVSAPGVSSTFRSVASYASQGLDSIATVLITYVTSVFTTVTSAIHSVASASGSGALSTGNYFVEALKFIIVSTYNGFKTVTSESASCLSSFLSFIGTSIVTTSSSLLGLSNSTASAIFAVPLWLGRRCSSAISSIMEAYSDDRHVSISETSQTLAFDINSTPMSIIKSNATLCSTGPDTDAGNDMRQRRPTPYKLRSRQIDANTDDEEEVGVMWTSTPVRGPRVHLKRGSKSPEIESHLSWPSYLFGMIVFIVYEILRLSVLAVTTLVCLPLKLVNKVYSIGSALLQHMFVSQESGESRIAGIFGVLASFGSAVLAFMNRWKWWILLFLLFCPLIFFLYKAKPEERIVVAKFEEYSAQLSENFDMTSLKLGACSCWQNFCQTVISYARLLWGFIVNAYLFLCHSIWSAWEFIMGLFADIGFRSPAVFLAQYWPSCPQKTVYVPVITPAEKDPIVAVETPELNQKMYTTQTQQPLYIQPDAQSMKKIKAELQAELEARLMIFEQSYQEKIEELKNQKNGVEYDYSQLSALIRQSIYQYDIDKTGLFDFALESAGASVISTRCSESYDSYSRLEKIWNIPLWYSSYGPRTVIQRNSNSLFPGECWCYKTGKGYLTISLSHNINISSISYEHIGKDQTPDGELRSAPREFKIWAYKSENDLQTRVLLGEFEYNIDEPSLQFFLIKVQPSFPVKIIEMEGVSNYGADFTCLYRLRVHGQLYTAP